MDSSLLASHANASAYATCSTISYPRIHTYIDKYIRKGYYLKSTNDIVTSSPYAHVSLTASALVNFSSRFASVPLHAKITK